jgi:hypothetical protein
MNALIFTIVLFFAELILLFVLASPVPETITRDAWAFFFCSFISLLVFAFYPFVDVIAALFWFTYKWAFILPADGVTIFRTVFVVVNVFLMVGSVFMAIMDKHIPNMVQSLNKLEALSVSVKAKTGAFVAWTDTLSEKFLQKVR